MMLEVLPAEFKEATPLITALEKAGFEAYFVGGSVRDALLGKRIHDVDIATSAYPEEVKQIFKRTVDVGIEHGTVLVLYEVDQYEVTTFRTESTYQDYRRPDEVTFVRSLAEDLKRRDFTINALAMNWQGEIVDLFQGIADLEDGVIKAVGDASERFNEDALRMLRALRFASQLGFRIEGKTFEAIVEHHRLLAKISIERIQIEFVKLMLGTHRRNGLEPFKISACYQHCPGFQEKATELRQLIELPEQPMTSEAMVWLVTFYCLEIPEKDWRLLLSQWKLSNQMIKVVIDSLKGLTYRLGHSWTAEWLYELGAEKVRLIEESMLYFGQEPQVAAALAMYESLRIHSIQELAVNGQDLLKATDLKPGPWVGRCLGAMEKAVINNSLANDRASLLTYAERLFAELTDEKKEGDNDLS